MHFGLWVAYYDDDLISDTQRFFIESLVGSKPTSV
jgi:hypothetical protein